jgi:hypothetical protein
MHFGCAKGFCHALFGWGFISGHGTYQWSSFPRKCLGCFGHFVFMCNLSTFLFHMGNTSFFFLLVFFGGFRWETYVSMWGHYGSKIMGIFSRPFSKTLGPTFNLLWWYKFFLSMEDYAPFVFLMNWILRFHICAQGFVFSIDPFWKNMFPRLRVR